MRYSSERRGCKNCAFMFRNEYAWCDRNKNGRCIGDLEYKYWKDVFDLCNGCKYQKTQVEDSSHCINCNQIHVQALENHYEPEI